MTYKALSIKAFGALLIETEDLDPVYCALAGIQTFDEDRELLARWLTCYWCLYHCGASSYLAEQPQFWRALTEATRNVEEAPVGGLWPRGTERRHWRGTAALKAIDGLQKRWHNPLDFVEYVAHDEKALLPSVPVKEVMDRVQEHRGFGPWIGFKVADMVDRVWRRKVDFTEASILMFDAPAEAADLIWTMAGNRLQKKDVSHREIIVQDLVSMFSHHKAPPWYDRPINVQEAETILCKWKSHINGHYPVGKDIEEIRHGLYNWAKVSELAAEFLQRMPKIDNKTRVAAGALL